jgi:16S rRNA (adenine1518-N6/adenine1519-N6)-dimethyltransferase
VERLVLPEPTGRKRKSFGQHFLRSEASIRAIVAAANCKEQDDVWEIGCGDGALTLALSERPKKSFCIVEKDPVIVEAAGQQWTDCEIVAMDATRLAEDGAEDYPPRLLQTPSLVVSNLPYSASTAIYRCFFEPRFAQTRLVLMFQKEVGMRIEGRERSDRGPLAILTELLFGLDRVAIVKPGAFSPPPKVDSIVLAFEPLPFENEAVAFVRENSRDLWQFLSKGFARRRKTLWNNLKPFWPAVQELEERREWLPLRPEQLSAQQWLCLFQDFRVNR